MAPRRSCRSSTKSAFCPWSSLLGGLLFPRVAQPEESIIPATTAIAAGMRVCAPRPTGDRLPEVAPTLGVRRSSTMAASVRRAADSGARALDPQRHRLDAGPAQALDAGPADRRPPALPGADFQGAARIVAPPPVTVFRQGHASGEVTAPSGSARPAWRGLRPARSRERGRDRRAAAGPGRRSASMHDLNKQSSVASRFRYRAPCHVSRPTADRLHFSRAPSSRRRTGSRA